MREVESPSKMAALTKSRCWNMSRHDARRSPRPPQALQLRTSLLVASLASLTACRPEPGGSPPDLPEVGIPRCDSRVAIDGKLDETCYHHEALVARFVVAGAPGESAPATRAWLFWDEDRLLFAFDCEDAHIAARAPSEVEKDVDPQDRVEIFLWSGRPEDAYHCLELAPLGAAHDYEARFYRRFDDSWAPAGLRWAAAPTERGYSVEGVVPREAMEGMGFKLRAGERWRLGLFRADFDGLAPGTEPRWITWVDRGGTPDFHVAGSFGQSVLEGRRAR